MAQAAPNPVLPQRLAVLREHREALLRKLGAATPAWQEVAVLVSRDPGLLHPILAARPLSGERLDARFHEHVAATLDLLGGDILKCWLLQSMWLRQPPEPRVRDTVNHAVRAADCALQLALAKEYPHAGEAYVAGLFLSLGQLRVAPHPVADAEASTPACPADDHALTAHLALACGLPLPVVDALLLQDALEEQLATAHPLSRLVWGAKALAGDDWETHGERLHRLLGLSENALFSLRNRVIDASFDAHAYEEAPMRPRRRADDHAGGALQPMPGTPDPVTGAMQHAIRSSMLRTAFARLDRGSIDERFSAACRLLCGTAAPLILVADEDGRVRPLPLGNRVHVRECLPELALRVDDPACTISLTLRTGTPTARPPEGGAPGRSVHDWHLNRWLGQSGFLCLPLSVAGCKAVAVIEDSPALHGPEVQSSLTDLAAAAAGAMIEIELRDQDREQIRAEVEARMREHGRRVVHEARNPLTVIKNYLTHMAQRHPDAIEMHDELDIVQSELDRLDRLIGQVTNPPLPEAEPAQCNVSDLLHEIQTLYAESLFGSRGIQFELRAVSGLPPAAMPASALKQVLINLMRNAAEALQPGRRLSIVLAGRLLSNGTPCLEIRVIDNGPGLPSDRMDDLFGARPSGKGGDHQGLGLAIVHEILEHWGASILCRSQPGTGTSFQLLVPLAKSG